MQQPNDDYSIPRVPPGNFNLIEHPFRPTRNYTPIEGLADRIQELENQGRFRTALRELCEVLTTHPNHPEALLLAVLVVGRSRTVRLHAQEPLSEADLLDNRLDAIFTVCSSCRKKSWVSDNYLLPYKKLMISSPIGLQCYNCGYVVCNDCMQKVRFGVGSSDISQICPHCHEEKLGVPVFPTGRLPVQMARHIEPLVHVIFFREGPVMPDAEYIQQLLEVVSPDVMQSGKLTITAFPVPFWPDDMNTLVSAVLVKMEKEGRLPKGSMLNAERATFQDEYGTRGFVVKVLQAPPTPQPQQPAIPPQAPGTQSSQTAYHLSQLHLPREGTSFEEVIADQKRALAAQSGVGSVNMYISFDELAARQPTDSPFVSAAGGRAIAVLRLNSLSADEAQQMREATEQSRLLLVPVLAECPTYPVLGLRFAIYDNLANPYIVEGPRGIQKADVQDFLQAVLYSGGGDFYLYTGVNAESLGSGKFLLCMPLFDDPAYPYQTRVSDIEALWKLLIGAANHLESIPVAVRDFDTAMRFYLEHTSLT